MEVRERGRCADSGHEFAPALTLENAFDAAAVAKVFGDSFLTIGHHKYNLAEAGGHRFFHRVLDERLVHHGEHLFWHRFRGGEEASPQARGEDDGL